MLFSTNQVRHFYVANTLSTDTYNEKGELVKGNTPTEVGGLYVKKISDDIQIQHMNGLKEIVGSDLIPIKKISSVTKATANKIAPRLIKHTITFDLPTNDNGDVVVEDYVLRIVFRQYVGQSDTDKYVKYGEAVFGSKIGKDKVEITKKNFATALGISLAKNISREYTKLIKIESIVGEITAGTVLEAGADATSDLTLTLTEVIQPWELGLGKVGAVPFDVQFVPVTYNGDSHYVDWGKVAESSEEAVEEEGKLIADLEYFCMGERGDVYRNVGFPRVIPTKYLIDPSKTYDVVTIHYAHSDDGLDTYNSEKDIQIACAAGQCEALYEAITTLITPPAKTEEPTV